MERAVRGGWNEFGPVKSSSSHETLPTATGIAWKAFFSWNYALNAGHDQLRWTLKSWGQTQIAPRLSTSPKLPAATHPGLLVPLQMLDVIFLG
jgi:hypothetical protein